MKTSRGVGILAVTAAGVLAVAACSSGGSASGNSIKASGSSAQKNAMTEWINSYQQANSGSTIDYQANGSGAGIQDFINNQTSFAGSDSAIKDADLQKASQRCGTGPAINIPMVGGAIVVAFNVAGVEKLDLSSSVVAQIFSGKITKWNAPAIASLNPGVKLPDAAIVQFHRSDSSGTTDNFTKYLQASAAKDWTTAPGKDWTAPGGQGAKGNDGVASSVKSTPNSVGYMELSFAQDSKIPMAAINNGGGAVMPTTETAQAGLASATVVGTGNDLSLKIDYANKAPGAYPIVLVTYEITCEKGPQGGALTLTKSFLQYTASDSAQGMLSGIGYVPLPASLLTKVNSSVNSIS